LYLENNKDKKAMKLIESIPNKYVQSTFYLWNGRIQEAILVLTLEINNNQKKLNTFDVELAATLGMFLVYHQKNMLYILFNEHPILKEVYKIIYFALLYELSDTHEKELATMPPELEESVKLLSEKIKRVRVKNGV